MQLKRWEEKCIPSDLRQNTSVNSICQMILQVEFKQNVGKCCFYVYFKHVLEGSVAVKQNCSFSLWHP